MIFLSFFKIIVTFFLFPYFTAFSIKFINSCFSKKLSEIIVYSSEIIISEEYTIISDNFLLKQLLINLIENAVKYGNKKKVTIILKKDKNITIEIIDRGKGISEENLNKIFEKFYREDKARSREEGSHGLGLSIVKKIANRLNINIEIESKIGIGSTVKIMFKK